MVHCAVMGCSNNNNKKCKNPSKCRFFTFPKDSKICQQWVLKCHRQDFFNTKTSYICSNHFVEDDFCLKEKLLQLPENKWKLKKDAVPSVNLMKPKKSLTTCQKNRISKIVKRENVELVEEFVEAAGASDIEPVQEVQRTKTVSTQTTSENYYTERIKDLESENNHLRKLLTKEKEEKEKLERLFSKGQLRKINLGKQVHWTLEDISSSLSLYAAGPRSYRLLMKRGYPLPSLPTLRRWASKINIQPASERLLFDIGLDASDREYNGDETDLSTDNDDDAMDTDSNGGRTPEDDAVPTVNPT